LPVQKTWDTRRRDVFHDQLGSVGRVPQLQVQGGCLRMLAHVGQRLLRGAVQRQLRIRGEWYRLTFHLETARNAALFAEFLDQRNQSVGPWQSIPAERSNSSTRLVQPFPSQPASPRYRGERRGIVRSLLEQHARPFDLNGQRRERMRQHIVNLTCDPRAFAQRSSFDLGIACSL
jgi:hypothetical protein